MKKTHAPLLIPVLRVQRQSDSPGFTLIELLVVVAIITVLATLLFAVLGGAKEKALQSAEISNLHQIGVANSLYADQNGRPALSFETLRQAGFIEVGMGASPRDNTVEGDGNRVLILEPSHKPITTRYRLSYVGYGDLVPYAPTFEEAIEHGNNLGWLVCLLDGQYQPHDPTPSSGKVRRLLMDTSVRSLPIQPSVLNGEEHNYTVSLFGEFTPEWLEKVYNEGK